MTPKAGGRHIRERNVDGKGRRHRRAAIALVSGLAVLAAIVIPVAALSATPHRYYVAIGASETLGYQPMSAGVQRATNQGYTNDLVKMETARWNALQLVTYACPGLRADIALTGRTSHPLSSMAAKTGSGRCRRRAGSEVKTAATFIRSHPGQVMLVTLDLGYPDVEACMPEHTVDPVCVTDALARVRSVLLTTIARLRAAGGTSLRIVGLTHEDPTVVNYLDQPNPDPTFAAASVSVIERFNKMLAAVYSSVGVRVADVAAAFSTGVTTPSPLPGHGTVPLEVKQICTLTWVCEDRNPHPNALGYRKIASVVASAILK